MDNATIESLASSTSAVLEAALGALPLAAYTNDLRGVVTWQNAASRELSGELLGKHFSKVVPRQELARSRETWAAVTLGGATRRRTGFFRGADGQLVELEVITAPMRMDGEIIGTFGIAIPATTPSADPRMTGELSPRQLDVLRLLVQGRSTAQIAEELHLARETVRNHMRGLFSALGARTRLEAALIALRHGLVPLDGD
jgi:PAS domain S-box-containing protein